ncbi:hypothetical protein CSUI_005244 [Cystoisospora suis]|uniref:Uncharacterized protein n=1 Tax=Cystoisospora suis TaxID=483139 RepID=A0A2C6KYB9_9APIC|nr:hypothetical protein CSUI_005244 [Cystoisospora suis]
MASSESAASFSRRGVSRLRRPGSLFCVLCGLAPQLFFAWALAAASEASREGNEFVHVGSPSILKDGGGSEGSKRSAQKELAPGFGASVGGRRDSRTAGPSAGGEMRGSEVEGLTQQAPATETSPSQRKQVKLREPLEQKQGIAAGSVVGSTVTAGTVNVVGRDRQGELPPSYTQTVRPSAVSSVQASARKSGVLPEQVELKDLVRFKEERLLETEAELASCGAGISKFGAFLEAVSPKQRQSFVESTRLAPVVMRFLFKFLPPLKPHPDKSTEITQLLDELEERAVVLGAKMQSGLSTESCWKHGLFSCGGEGARGSGQVDSALREAARRSDTPSSQAVARSTEAMLSIIHSFSTGFRQTCQVLAFHLREGDAANASALAKQLFPSLKQTYSALGKAVTAKGFTACPLPTSSTLMAQAPVFRTLQIVLGAQKKVVQALEDVAEDIRAVTELDRFLASSVAPLGRVRSHASSPPPLNGTNTRRRHGKRLAGLQSN